jgi:hypothetical protein
VHVSEKLYKAAEEAVKALAKCTEPEDVLRRVRERGRWAVEGGSYISPDADAENRRREAPGRLRLNRA